MFHRGSAQLAVQRTGKRSTRIANTTAKNLLEIFKEPDRNDTDDFINEFEADDIDNQLRHSQLGSEGGKSFNYITSNEKPKIKGKFHPTKSTGMEKRKNETNEQQNLTARDWTLKVAKRISDLSVHEFAQFTKISLLGRGAFGKVYKVYHEPSGRIFAMKTIVIKQSENNPDAILKEILIMKNLRHPNIVRLNHYHLNTHELDLVMEFCSGGSLRTIIREKGGLPESRVIQYTRQILNGLSYLHAHGIIHRDIKAANILLDGDIVKLADFGVSLNVNDKNLRDTIRKEPYGSVYWMAPEVIKLQGATKAADIWSLGATILELLTGEPPFSQYDPLPACHAIGVGERIVYPKSISRDCFEFLDKNCLVYDPGMRLTSKELKHHRWLAANDGKMISKDSNRAKLSKFEETPDDYENYEDEFETLDIDIRALNNRSRNKNMNMFAEISEDFDDGFDFSDSSSDQEDKLSSLANEIHIIKSIPNCGVDDLARVHTFDNVMILNKLVEHNFLLELIYCLNDEDKTDQLKIEMLRIANALFEKRISSLEEFCVSGSISQVLELYDDAPQIVLKFISLLKLSKTCVQNLGQSGTYIYVWNIFAQGSLTLDYQAEIIHLLSLLFNNEKTRKDQITACLVARNVPIALSSSISELSGSNLDSSVDEVMDILNIMLDFVPTAHKNSILTLRFYKNIFSSYHTFCLKSRFKALRIIMMDDDQSRSFISLASIPTLIQLLVQDLVDKMDSEIYKSFAEYAIDFIAMCCRDSEENVEDLIDCGGIKMLHVILTYSQTTRHLDKQLREKVSVLLFRVLEFTNEEKVRRSTKVLLSMLLMIIDDPKYGQQTLAKILDFEQTIGLERIVQLIDQPDNISHMLKGLLNTNNFYGYCREIQRAIIMEMHTENRSILAVSIGQNEAMLEFLWKKLKHVKDRDGEMKYIMQFLFVIFRNCGALNSELREMDGELRETMITAKNEVQDNEVIQIMRKMIHLLRTKA